MHRWISVFAGLVLAFFPQHTAAETAIIGTVTDAEEIPVAGAHIAFIYEGDTLQVFDATTASDGGYTVLLSPISPSFSTAVEEIRESGIPRTFQLLQNYPNPFNPNTVIQYALPEPGYVELSIYNVLGHRIRTLVDRYQEAGGYAVEWNGRNARGMGLSAGVYLYRLKAGAYEAWGKMAMVDGAATKRVAFGRSRSHKPCPGSGRTRSLYGTDHK